jgi:hypothetical protein
MDTLKILLKDSRFWAALWLVVQTILFYFLPTFPPEIWSAVNGLFAVVLAVLAVPVAMSTARSVRAARDANTRG